ncbi:MAG: hypothetical protein JSS81_19725 [Acidobacteria bacterium]|nr:hypothetical protein [Acidobacteriota bacterium]
MSDLKSLIGRGQTRIWRIYADFFFLKNKTKNKSVKTRVIRVIRGLFGVPPESIVALNLFLHFRPLAGGRPGVPVKARRAKRRPPQGGTRNYGVRFALNSRKR